MFEIDPSIVSKRIDLEFEIVKRAFNSFKNFQYILESLILAQNERWRRA